jgi:small-conductance mechanosensitive channel
MKGTCPGFSVHENAAHAIITPLAAEILQLNLRAAIQSSQKAQTTDRLMAELQADLKRIEAELENLIAYARQGAISVEQLREHNTRLLAERKEKQDRIDRLAHSGTNLARLDSFSDEFMENLPDFVDYLYQHRTPLFNQVLRLIFSGVVLNSDRRGANWKKGLTLGNKKATRTYHLQSVIFDPRFDEWTDQYGFVMPKSIDNLAYRCTTTGVPISAHSKNHLASSIVRFTQP